MRKSLLAGAVVAAAFVFAAIVSYALAYGDARRGREALTEAVHLLTDQDVTAARAKIDQAESAFTQAGRHLRDPWTKPVAALPLIDRNVDAIRRLVDAGVIFTDAGRHACDAIDQIEAVVVRSGRVDLGSIDNASLPAKRTLQSAIRAQEIIEQRSSSLLVNAIEEARNDALARSAELIENTRQTVIALDALPRLLGKHRRMRYFVTFSNLAELRGTGGLLGYFTVIDVEGGRVKLPGQRGRPQEDIPLPAGAAERSAPDWFKKAYGPYEPFATWGNLNLSSDFATVGRIISASLPSELGKIDAVIQVDPIALSALLHLTGPIEVPEWPVPISSKNVAAITQHDAYVRLKHDARVSFLGDVVDGVFSKVLGGEVRMKPGVVRRLVAAAIGGHLQAFGRQDRDQRVFRSLGVSREVSRAKGNDVLGLVTNNSSGNKLDWYLRRRMTYNVELDPRTGTAATSLEVQLRNEAPARGLPDYIIASPDRTLADGENRAIIVTLRSPRDLLATAELGGKPVRPAFRSEDQLLSYHLIGRVPSRRTLTMSMDTILPKAVSGSGRHRTYRLTVLRQPTATPDRFEIDVAVPKGWRAKGPTVFAGPLRSDLAVRVEMIHTWRAWAFERAVLGPWRLALDLWPLIVATLVLIVYLLARRFDPFNRRAHTR